MSQDLTNNQPTRRSLNPANYNPTISNQTPTPRTINNNQNQNTNSTNKSIKQMQQSQQNQQQNQQQRQVSPTRYIDSLPGTRIAKRELWWKEPPPSQVKIPTSAVKIDNVAPKVDHRNVSYSPSKTTKTIETQKLVWNAQPVIDSWSNLKHQPGGGNKKYPTENLQWQASPKVDTGFIYTFQE